MAFRFSRSFFLFLFLFLSFQGLLTPRPLEAALVPCGRTFDDPLTSLDESAPCTVCHLVLGSENVIQWGLKVMTFIAVAVIVAMAILYIVSAGDEGLMGTAKSGIKAALIGFAVMLGAWLIVNLVVTTLADTTDPNKPFYGLIKQGAFQFTCDTRSNAGTASGIAVDPGTYTSGGGTETSSGDSTKSAGKLGNGKCEPVKVGPCSVENLRKSCFGQNAEIASAICNVESGGNPQRPSNVDLCRPGKEPASWGLFQINLSANTIGGLACPAPSGAFDRMFTGSNKDCSVRQPLYGSCVDKAKETAANLQKACELSKNGTNWGPWRYTKNKCGF